MRTELVSPEGILFEGDAKMVAARTLGGGDIAFLPGHEPFIGVLAVHPVTVIMDDDSRVVIACQRGFVECSGTSVVVLSDAAVLADDINVEGAREDLAAAEDALRTDGEDEDAALAKRWAEVRLQVAGASAA